MGFLKKPASTKQKVGFLSGLSKVGFIENYVLNNNNLAIFVFIIFVKFEGPNVQKFEVMEYDI